MNASPVSRYKLIHLAVLAAMASTTSAWAVDLIWDGGAGSYE